MENVTENTELLVSFRDVLLFRASKENFLTANETNKLLLDIIRNTRTQLLNAVSSEETISIKDAVCNLRDVLVMCHFKGDTWENLALELNQLFDKKNKKPFTVQDLLAYLKAEPEHTLSFAPPYEADNVDDLPSGFMMGVAQSQGASQDKAETESAEPQENKADVKPDEECADSDKSSQSEDCKEEEPKQSTFERQIYTAKDQDDQVVDWAELIGKTISCNGVVYKVSADKRGNTIFLTSITNETLEASDFNDHQVKIEIVDTKDA